MSTIGEPKSQGILTTGKEIDAENDSLFSSEKSEERVVKIQTPEAEDLLPEQEYDEEELAQLVAYIKDMTILYDLRPGDWTDECEQVISLIDEGYMQVQRAEEDVKRPTHIRN